MLNGTQRSVLEAVIDPILQSFVEELEPEVGLVALGAVVSGTIPAEHQGAIEQQDLVYSIGQLHEIYTHPYVQNRAVGSIHNTQEPGWVLYHVSGQGTQREREGLLGLTALNHSTVEPVTREDVVGYLNEKLTAFREQIEASLVSAPATQIAEPAAPLQAEGSDVSQPVAGAASVNSIALYMQAVVNFSLWLKALISRYDNYEPQADLVFLGSILKALRCQQWMELCQRPENFGVPAALMPEIKIYVQEHAALRPSELLNRERRTLETEVTSASIEPLAVSVSQLSVVGLYAPAPAAEVGNAPAESTLANLAEAVMAVHQKLDQTLRDFPRYDQNAAAIYLASFLRSIRKEQLSDFYGNPEDYAAVPRSVIPFLKNYLAQYPVLKKAKDYSGQCHRDIEKRLRNGDLAGVRSLFEAQNIMTLGAS